MPARIQLRRTRGWRMPAGAVKVDRTTLFGNPFSAEAFGRPQAVALHRSWITGEISDAEISAGYTRDLAEQLITRRRRVCEALPTLRGRDLACWCSLPEPYDCDVCHAAALLELANPDQRD